MNAEKYNKTVELACPTCGGSQFSYDDVEPTCVGCNRVLTRETLIEVNQENISQHIEDMKPQIIKDAGDELRRMLKK